ncbi:MAG: NAD+ synthase [Burkholderiaceae bacterium]|jgi:NAD+ synthase (glutamine-hydrolysing)|nr:NAD+ synthase [Burkholderiaceae bacterium]
MTLKIAVAQLNFTVGDITGNARRIAWAASTAHAQGAHLLLTPELSICGCSASDLLLRPSFIVACDEAVATIAGQTAGLAGLTLVIGHPASAAQGLCNAASVIRDGRVIGVYAKRALDDRMCGERRWFAPGQGAGVFEVQDFRVGLLIGQDAELEPSMQQARQAGAELLAAISAAPYYAGQGSEREALMAERARARGLPLVCVCPVGGQDEVVFAGRSFAVAADGRLVGRAPSFAEQLAVIGVTRAGAALRLAADIAPTREADADLWDALVMGLRDYAGKSGFQSAVLGLSGGIDSALVLALAVDALGRERVSTVTMPSPYTAAISLEDARDMARRLGVRLDDIDIQPLFERLRQSLHPLFGGKTEDATEENLQARIRGVLLMALSNKHGHLLLTTGNKSEYATGYCTLYGDMCGGFAPIKDVLKTAVFRLARWRNAHDPYGSGANPIPERIITRAPSAELRPDQTDQDSLPPYEVLDAIIERYVENDASSAELIAAGFGQADVEQVARLLKASEYKRRQSAPGTRVTRRGFGGDWRYPIASKFRA